MKTLLFDLDDTLLVYSGVTDQAWEQACTKYQQQIETFTKKTGTPLSPAALAKTISTISHQYWADPVRHKQGRLNLHRARRKVVRQTFEFLNVLPQQNPNHKTSASLVTRPLSPIEELAQNIADTFTTVREELVTLYPNALETLQTLKQRGHTMGLITNGSQQFQQAKIDRFHLAPYFQTILIEGELGFGKPDPRVFQKALSDLKATPQETFMIGDHLEWDIQGAAAVGIKTVWFNGATSSTVLNAGNTNPANTTTKSKSSTRPDHTIHSLAELLEIPF